MNVREAVHDFNSVILRNLDGNISYWNVTSERHYGFSRREAVGQISHTLLETIFPRPLREINECLQTTGVWQGELIHTLSDGTRVKVQSHWQLLSAQADPSQAVVLEVNSPLVRVEPETAFVKDTSAAGHALERVASFFVHRIWWLLLPIVITVTAVLAVLGVTDSVHPLVLEQATDFVGP